MRGERHEYALAPRSRLRPAAAALALPPPPGANEIVWRVVLGDVPPGLPKEDALAIVNSRYRKRAAEASGDDGELRRLNLAVEAARKELAG